MPYIIAAIIVFGVIFIFNKLVRNRQLVREAWSGIDVQLKRRHDLIPNLVETVKGYASFEKSVLDNIARLRSQPFGNVPEVARTENQLTAAIRDIFAVAESYPDLKASTVFQDFQSALVKVEDDIQYARRYYNGTVRDYNTLAQSFPGNLIAAVFKFESQPFFEIEYATERETPDVAFF